MSKYIARTLMGLTVITPEEIGPGEANAYAIRAIDKYGKENVQGIHVKMVGENIQIYYRLKDQFIEDLPRPSEATIALIEAKYEEGFWDNGDSTNQEG